MASLGSEAVYSRRPPLRKRGLPNNGTQQLKGENLQTSNKYELEHKDGSKLYSLLNLLGTGSTCKVYKARAISTQRKVAVKLFDTPRVKHVVHEIRLLQACAHPNIVGYKEAFHFKSAIWMVMELIDGQPLTHFTSFKWKGDGSSLGSWQFEQWSERSMAFVLQEVLKALDHIHAKNIVHRDIKSDNILVAKGPSGANSSCIKLVDFGLAEKLTVEKPFLKDKIGTHFWLAPEVVDSRSQNQSCDIWSLGITALEMMMHEPPYVYKVRNKNTSKVEEAISTYPPPTHANLLLQLSEGEPVYYDWSKPRRDLKTCSDNLVSFLGYCLQYQSGRRATARKLLTHRLLEDASTQEDFQAWLRDLDKQFCKYEESSS